ncbi:peptide MFS transporter [Tautonia sociabilis]|uniref:MFS transporter n=1 Tax=Tautonia sociabilis TaxID=2080755 RepID=A0A432MJP9_9BACT|nr:peptide MFS transporter [Tautonia sociabilis]RUL87405.1 MFS transporter [Tautonia sociabilis]
MSSSEGAVAVAPPPTRRGHPPGLYVLFGAEMWERFSYYGMRALLVLYLTNHLGVDRTSALDVYATYTGLVYLTPFLGGLMADRYLGQRKAVLIGGILMALGHFAMAFEPLLNVALGLLILGNGFFKPNISTMVGQLYPQGDPRRDGAYTIFYMGINLGAFVAPLACGYLGESPKYGWHYGFGLAGVGMVLGLLNFALFQKTLGHAGFPPGRHAEGQRITARDWFHVVLLSAIGVGGVVVAVLAIPAVNAVLPAGAAKSALLTLFVLLAGAFGSVIAFTSRSLGVVAPSDGPIARPRLGDVANVVEPGRDMADPAGTQTPPAPRTDDDDDDEDPSSPFTSAQWQRIFVALIISAFSIFFWAGFEQSGGTLNLFADTLTERAVPPTLQGLTGGEEIPASWFQSINPLLILILAIPFSILWTTLDRTRFSINSAAKFGLGLILLGAGMAVMFAAESNASEENKASPLWLVLVYFLFTSGELCLSPIGLSLINKLAPARVASLMMALWFVCTAAANYLAGKMESIVGEGTDLWRFLFLFAVIPGVVLLVINPLLKKMAHGRI